VSIVAFDEIGVIAIHRAHELANGEANPRSQAPDEMAGGHRELDCQAFQPIGKDVWQEGFGSRDVHLASDLAGYLAPSYRAHCPFLSMT
jgi:hypothetical protein